MNKKKRKEWNGFSWLFGGSHRETLPLSRLLRIKWGGWPFIKSWRYALRRGDVGGCLKKQKNRNPNKFRTHMQKFTLDVFFSFFGSVLLFFRSFLPPVIAVDLTSSWRAVHRRRTNFTWTSARFRLVTSTNKWVSEGVVDGNNFTFDRKCNFTSFVYFMQFGNRQKQQK